MPHEHAGPGPMGLFVISDGRDTWCVCQPLTERDAAVVGGTWCRWDVLRLPEGQPWDAAGRPWQSPGDARGPGRVPAPAETPVTPFDVETVFDAVTGHAADTRYSELADLSTSPALTQAYAAWLDGLRTRQRRAA